MTKIRRSSRGSAMSKRHSALRTPKRNAIRETQFSDENDDGNSADLWDFDAPTYYDFKNARTPGVSADRWFDYAHPTPALRKSRASRKSTDSILSIDSVESLVPNRPSLSPSRVIVEDGRLTIEGASDSEGYKSPSAAGLAVENIEFSDTDEEIEFNNWKRAHSLPHDDGDDDDAGDTKGYEEEEEEEQGASDATVGASDANQHQASDADTATSGSSDDNGNGSDAGGPQQGYVAKVGMKPAAAASIKRSSGTLDGRVTKKRARPAKVTAPKPLTIPEERGFMRPTKVVSHRLSMKKRDKVTKQMIANAITKSINRRLSKDGTASLTIPRPFHFHETKASHAKPLSVQPEQKARLPTERAYNYLNPTAATKRKAAETMDDSDHSEGAGPQSSPKRKLARPAKSTMPKTPQFATDKRVKREKKLGNKVVAISLHRQLQNKAQAKGTHKARAQISPPKPTVPQPFTFRSDAIAERHLAKLREEMAKLREEKEALQQFHANPIPAFPTPKKPKREPAVSRTSPFNLQTETRGEAYQRSLQERLAELENRRRERAQFRARPIPSSIDLPFVPQPSAMPLTQIEEILLSTELRSEERRAYDEDRHERERIRQEVLERKRLEDERREEEEIKQLRKMLVHKAQPIRHFNPIIIKPSDKPATVPKTPQWHVRTRRASTPSTPTQK